MFATDDELIVFKRIDGSPMSDAESCGRAA
jgi:hypothetical protein